VGRGVECEWARQETKWCELRFLTLLYIKVQGKKKEETEMHQPPDLGFQSKVGQGEQGVSK